MSHIIVSSASQCMYCVCYFHFVLKKDVSVIWIGDRKTDYIQHTNKYWSFKILSKNVDRKEQTYSTAGEEDSCLLLKYSPAFPRLSWTSLSVENVVLIFTSLMLLLYTASLTVSLASLLFLGTQTTGAEVLSQSFSWMFPGDEK